MRFLNIRPFGRNLHDAFLDDRDHLRFKSKLWEKIFKRELVEFRNIAYYSSIITFLTSEEAKNG